VVAHEDAVEAELLRVAGLLGRVCRRPVGAWMQPHRDLQPAAYRTTTRVLPRVVRASIAACVARALERERLADRGTERHCVGERHIVRHVDQRVGGRDCALGVAGGAAQ
jgi:hypothetical protein